MVTKDRLEHAVVLLIAFSASAVAFCLSRTLELSALVVFGVAVAILVFLLLLRTVGFFSTALLGALLLTLLVNNSLAEIPLASAVRPGIFALLIAAGLSALLPVGGEGRTAVLVSQPQVSGALVFWPVLGILAVVSSLWSVSPVASLWKGAAMLAVLFAVGSAVCSRWIVSHLLSRDLSVIFIAATAVQLVGLIVALVGVEGAFLWERYQGLLTNPNYASALGALQIFLGTLIRRRGRVVWPVLSYFGFATGLTAVILSGSRAGIAALVLGSIVALLAARRAIVLALSATLAIFTALVVAASVGDDAGRFISGSVFGRTGGTLDISSGRLGLWENLIPLWRQNWALGVGFDGVRFLPLQIAAPAHNLYLAILVELGLVGFVVFFVCASFLVSRTFVAGGAFLGLLVFVAVFELFDSSLSDPSAFSTVLLLFCLGAGYSCGNNQRIAGGIPSSLGGFAARSSREGAGGRSR